MRVIADSYSKLCSQSSQPRGHVADATLKMQVQGNAILYIFLDDGICIRNKHTLFSSNDAKYSLTLFLAQQFTNLSKAENLVTNSCSVTMSSQPFHAWMTMQDDKLLSLLTKEVHAHEAGSSTHLMHVWVQ